jgi:hypothetical protein
MYSRRGIIPRSKANLNSRGIGANGKVKLIGVGKQRVFYNRVAVIAVIPHQGIKQNLGYVILLHAAAEDIKSGQYKVKKSGA